MPVKVWSKASNYTNVTLWYVMVWSTARWYARNWSTKKNYCYQEWRCRTRLHNQIVSIANGTAAGCSILLAQWNLCQVLAYKGHGDRYIFIWIFLSFLSPHERAIVHTHSQYVSALTAMKDFQIKQVHQNSCRFYGNMSYDSKYDGIATSQSDEGKRVAELGEDFSF